MSLLLNPEVAPGGILTGPIVKPMAWRRHNDHKGFVAEWHQFVRKCRNWQYNHPIRKLDRFLWEREKDIWRAWWFQMTPAERKYLLAWRDDHDTKIFLNPVFAKEFKGFRYQKGFLSGGGARRAAWSGGGDTLTLGSSNNDAFNIDFNPGSPLRAGFYLRDDGTLDRVDSSGTAQINSSADWVRPTGVNKGDDYEAKWNKLTGGASAPNDETFTEDVWTTLTTDESVTDNRSTASVPHSYEFDIGDDGTSTSDVNQDYSAEAGDII